MKRSSIAHVTRITILRDKSNVVKMPGRYVICAKNTSGERLCLLKSEIKKIGLVEISVKRLHCENEQKRPYHLLFKNKVSIILFWMTVPRQRSKLKTCLWA